MSRVRIALPAFEKIAHIVKFRKLQKFLIKDTFELDFYLVGDRVRVYINYFCQAVHNTRSQIHTVNTLVFSKIKAIVAICFEAPYSPNCTLVSLLTFYGELQSQ